jgi:putative transposase
MTHHLGYEKNSKSNNSNDNYHNGYGSKRIITDDEELNINPPRDRNGSFKPQIIGKRENRFSVFDDNIIFRFNSVLFILSDIL